MKNELTTIVGGKTYKEATLVMLTTETPSQLTQQGGKRLVLEKFKSGGNRGQNQHLYALSDEEIKLGDWYLFFDYPENPRLLFCKHTDEADRCNNHYLIKEISSKIIATTDNLQNSFLKEDTGFITIPRFSNEFLKRYCELGGIDKCLIQYEWIGTSTMFGFSMGNASTDGEWEVKVASDNTVSIKPFVVKDSWTRDEVIKLLKGWGDIDYKNGQIGGFGGEIIEFEDWINNNLK